MEPHANRTPREPNQRNTPGPHPGKHPGTHPGNLQPSPPRPTSTKSERIQVNPTANTAKPNPTESVDGCQRRPSIIPCTISPEQPERVG
eukprot:scaffold90296_cov68-Phaeocystis_antarctica.AAC.7